MATDKQLKKAAIELNDVMGLTPEINVKGATDVLTKGIKAASKHITPDDDFSEETQAVINEVLGVKASKVEAPAAKGKKAPVVVEDDDEDDDAADEEIEEEDVDDNDEEEDEIPAPKKGKKVVAPAVVVPEKKAKKPVVVEDDDDEEEEEEVAPVKKAAKKVVAPEPVKKEKVITTPKWQILIQTIAENPKASFEQIEKILQKGGHSISKHSIEVYFKEVHFALSFV